MDVTVRLFVTSADVDESLRQMEDVFGSELARRAAGLPPVGSVRSLVFAPQTSHPVFGRSPRTRATFERGLGATYYVHVPVSYVEWASEDWRVRVEAYAEALLKGVAALPKSRFALADREALKLAVVAAKEDVQTRPPSRMASVSPVYLYTNQDGKVVGAGFCAEPATRGNVIEIKAHEAAKYVDQGPLWGEPQELQMFKLYRREADKKLFYREAWIDGERVVEHWGACGERGDVREHPAPNAKDAQRVLSRLKRAARDDGFKPIPRSRMATLIVEYPIDPCRSGDDLTRRHELEDRLNELIGWLGLGHMDGGSIGSGTMEVCLIVVDFQIAKDTLEEAMRGTDMDGFSQIYRLK